MSIFGRISLARQSALGGAGARSGHELAPRILLVTCLLLAFLHVANGLFILHFYRTNASREQEARDATATLLAEQASHALTAIDLTLDTIATKLEPHMAENRATVVDQALLGEEGMRLPQLRQIVVLDRAGKVLLDSRQFPAGAGNLGAQRYFADHLVHPGRNLFIGGLILGDGAPQFSMSRGAFDAQGNLVGVVAALIDPRSFRSVESLRVSDSLESALLIRNEDGSVLAGEAAEKNLRGATAGEILAKRPRSVLAVRQVVGFPLQLMVIGTPPAASQAFRKFVIFDVSIMFLVTIVALWLASRLTDEARARATAETRLRAAIESAPGALALFDAQDRLALRNESYLDYYPSAIRPLIVPGIRFESLIELLANGGGYAGVTDDLSRRAMIERRLLAHREARGEIVQQFRDGRWTLTRERRTKEGGTVCFYTDITQMKQQEQALRKSERVERQAREAAERADSAKSSFLATMSHELRTPLNAVIGFSEIIEQGLFGPQPLRYREYASMIRQSGEHLLIIINDILDIAKLQSGKTELHLETVAIGDILDQAVRLVEPQIQAGGIALTQRIAGDLPLLRADQTRLRQVLLNLLSNSIKFTPAGGTISLTAHRSEGAVMVTIADTGIGMAEADIPKALEPFGQVSNAMTRVHQGTGLGLPLSKSLVELHGGSFEIVSALGIGTSVTITLPAAAIGAAEMPSGNRRGVG